MLKLTLEAAITQTLEVASRPQVVPLLEQFTGVYVQDSTWISLPDELHGTWKGPPKKNHRHKAALKLHLCFDVLTGRFQQFHITDGMTADSSAAKAADPLPPGSLRLADLAYFSLDTLEKLTQDGIYWISRLKANSYLSDETGEPLDLEKMLRETEEDTHIRKPIRIGKRKQLQAHLIAERLSQAETDKRRRSIRYRAKRKAQTPSKTLLRLAGWNLYITNIKADPLTPKQIVGIVSIRWQIELMFKGFKSIGKLQDSRSQKPYRILAEIYAKLIALLIQQAVMLSAGYRHIQHSFIKTARYIAGYARLIALSFHHSKTALRKTLKAIKQAFDDGGSFQKSTGKNTTFHRLKDATENP